MECKSGLCKKCGSNVICQLGLIDSEVYCMCKHCGNLKCCCDDKQANICNNVLNNKENENEAN